MLFNSYEFLLFLPIVFILYWFIFNKTIKIQNILLLVASYFFYGFWSWKFLGLLFTSTLLDYLYGFGVDSTNRKKAKLFLWLGVINNLGILAIFKYYNFFAVEFQTLFSSIGLNFNIHLINLALPIGISFYTFHGMSYVFDIYRKNQKPVKSFIDYAVFVSFFPLLVAGPIERAHHLLPQIQRKRIFKYSQAMDGIKLIIWGMFKKVVIADSLATTSNDIFNHYESKNAFALIIGVLSFSFQIYGDFSGYSDIALGTAKLFGFELLSNFRFPYFSRDLAEFWRRWHISLSSWFRDYLYFPLGGSRNGKLIAVRNTLIIFLVSGFWHGASWNFIIWGGIHAAGFVPLLIFNQNRKNVTNVVAENNKFPTLGEIFKILTTFTFVSFAWIFFRAQDFKSSIGYISRIFQGIISEPRQFLSLPEGKSALIYIIPLIFLEWGLRRNERNLNFGKYQKIVLGLIFIITILFLINSIIVEANQSFIYFQF